MYDIDVSCLALVLVRAFVRDFCYRDRSTTASAAMAAPQEKELEETGIQSAMEETKETVDDAVQTEAPSGVRGVTTPPLSRTETADSVEIVGGVLA